MNDSQPSLVGFADSITTTLARAPRLASGPAAVQAAIERNRILRIVSSMCGVPFADLLADVRRKQGVKP